MNVDDIANFSWELVSIIGKGGSSTVYKASLQPLQSLQQQQLSSVSSSLTAAATASSPSVSIHSPLPMMMVNSSNGGGLFTYVAVKEIDLDALNKNQLDAIQAEINNMKALYHLHIVNYYGMQQRYHRIYIFMEYAKYGSLRQFYLKYGKLKEYETYYCLKQILLGLQYLHFNGFAHRDVKCANCLLFEDPQGIVKLADFGASKKFESESIVSGLKGTPHWMAPEVIKGNQMTSGWIKADVWSLGCTVVEMITGKLPYWYYENPMTAMYRIANGEIPKINYDSSSTSKTSSKTDDSNSDSDGAKLKGEEGKETELIEISPELNSFIEVCCALEPTQRPTVDELLQHPFIVKYSGEAAEIPPRLFALQEEILNIPIAPTQTSLTLSNNDPNRLSQGRFAPLHPISVDDSVNLPSGIAHPSSATNRKYIINTNLSYLKDSTNPLTFESQATPAMGMRRNFSINFDDPILAATDSTSSFILPPRSATNSASYVNNLAFSREGTANASYQSYYPPPLTSTSNPASQRNTASRPNRFSDSYNSQSEEFDLIKQTKISDLLIPTSSAYSLDDHQVNVSNSNNQNGNIFGNSRELREDHSRGMLLAPIKSMDPDDYGEDEILYVQPNFPNNNSTNNENNSANQNPLPHCKSEDQIDDEVEDHHYREDFEKDEEVEEQIEGGEGAHNTDNHQDPPVPMRNTTMNVVPYRYTQKKNEDFSDSFEDSYDSNVAANKKSTPNKNQNEVKPNITPVKIQNKGNLLQASLKKKDNENYVVERPTAPLTSEKLVFTETGELSPIKQNHLLHLNSDASMEGGGVGSNNNSFDDSGNKNHIPRAPSEDSLNSSKKLHKMSDYVQLSPSEKSSKNFLFPNLPLENKNSADEMEVQDQAENKQDDQLHQDALLLTGLKVNRLQGKVGAKFIHHPPPHSHNTVHQQPPHQQHRLHHPTEEKPNSHSKAKPITQKTHKRATSEKLQSLSSATNASTMNTISAKNGGDTFIIQNNLSSSTSRSLSAGATLVSSHSNQNLLGKKGGGKGISKNGKKVKPNLSAKLPPLDQKKGENEDNNCEEDEEEEQEVLGKRYVQSAPAVSRSVNLPPINRPVPIQQIGDPQLPSHPPAPQNNNHTNHQQAVLTSVTPTTMSRKFVYSEQLPISSTNTTTTTTSTNHPGSNRQVIGYAASVTVPSTTVNIGKAKLLDSKKPLGGRGHVHMNNSNYGRLQAVPEIGKK